MTLTYLSLGAGVQSSTLALMASRGIFKPMPEAAIFADTQAEPEAVYRWLDWLEGQLAFPVVRVTRGNLGEDACRVRTSAAGNHYTKHAVPAFTVDAEGQKTGMAMRQCTFDHKISVLLREYDRRRNGKAVVQWVGISRDEAHRMKPAPRSWLTNVYPLVDAGITRTGCLDWMRGNGYPQPPRSACVFCPYRNDSEWRRLRDEDPKSFQAAAEFERRYQAAFAHVTGWRGTPYLHRSCVPLEQVDLREVDEKSGQLNFNFGNECEGMCGV